MYILDDIHVDVFQVVRSDVHAQLKSPNGAGGQQDIRVIFIHESVFIVVLVCFLLPHYFTEQFWRVFLKKIVSVFLLFGLLLFVLFSESIHIELPDERGVVIMIEIYRQYLITELIYVCDNESIASVTPTNKIAMLAALG